MHSMTTFRQVTLVWKPEDKIEAIKQALLAKINNNQANARDNAVGYISFADHETVFHLQNDVERYNQGCPHLRDHDSIEHKEHIANINRLMTSINGEIEIPEGAPAPLLHKTAILSKEFDQVTNALSRNLLKISPANLCAGVESICDKLINELQKPAQILCCTIL